MPEPRFFRTAAAFRTWLAANHAHTTELLVVLHRKGSGRPSLTWSESVDEALCYGWIDGVRRTIDGTSYSIRFTPRKPKSIWSKVNVAKVTALIRQGRMQPAGLAAYVQRAPERTGIYSFERAAAVFDASAKETFERSKPGWAFFQAQAPSYRKLATHYVTSAKRPETRQKRLEALIERSAHGERLPRFVSSRHRP